MANATNKRMYWPAIASGLFCLIVICSVVYANFVTLPPDFGNAPRFHVRVKFPRSSRVIYFQKMAGFADQQGFDFHVGPVDPNDKGYSVYLDRSDLFISSVNPWDPMTFEIGIYAHEGVSVTDIELKPLIAKLDSLIGSIPGVERQ